MKAVWILLFAAASTAAQSTCAASGTVTDRVTGQPVARAKLMVQAGRGIRSGQTDNSGRWSIAELPCGRAAISASRFGYLDSRQTRSITAPVQLEPGSPAQVGIELTPQAVITGKVSDQNGDPVMGVRVVPYIERAEAGRRVMQPAPQTVSDDRGEFRIPQLEPGRYIVCAEPAPGEQGYGTECYPADLSSGAREAMSVRPGMETNADFTLREAWRVRVSGRVTGAPDGMPVSVQLAQRPAAMFGPRMGTAAAADGSFSFPAVAPGSYLLVASSGANGKQYSGRAPVEVGNAALENISLSLGPDVDIAGTVEMESSASAAAPGSPEVNIALVSVERDGRPGQVEWSDDRHSFTIAGVSPGTWSLRITGPDVHVKSATLDGRDVTSGDFTVSEAPGALRIVVSRESGALEGEATASDSAAAGWIVLLRDGSPLRSFPAENGHFTARNLPPGDYTVYAWDDLRTVEYAEPDWMRQNASAGVAVTVTAGQTANIKVPLQTAPSDY